MSPIVFLVLKSLNVYLPFLCPFLGEAGQRFSLMGSGNWSSLFLTYPVHHMGEVEFTTTT